MIKDISRIAARAVSLTKSALRSTIREPTGPPAAPPSTQARNLRRGTVGLGREDPEWTGDPRQGRTLKETRMAKRPHARRHKAEPDRYVVRVVVFEEEGWHVAQCIEYDLATQSKKLTDLYYEVEKLLVGQLVAAEETGRAPFQNLPPAPQRFTRMWNDAVLDLTPRTRAKFKKRMAVAPDIHLRAA